MIMLVPAIGESGSVSWSMVRPCALLNVLQSRCAATTSSKRDSAQNPNCSLWYTGASSRSHRYMSYGSSKKSAENGLNSML